MNQPPRMITEAHQSYSFSRRAVMLGAGQAGIGLLLAGRMAWLAIEENEHYSLLSESNRVNMTMVPPRRGWIVDRHGVPIANNRTDFRVDIIPDRLPKEQIDQVSQHANTLAMLMGLKKEARAKLARDVLIKAARQRKEKIVTASPFFNIAICSPSTDTNISRIPASSGDCRLTVIVATCSARGSAFANSAPVFPPGGRTPEPLSRKAMKTILNHARLHDC